MKLKMILLILGMVIPGILFAQAPGKPIQAEMPSTNDPELDKMIKDFYGSARYYKVDYKDELLKIKEVKYMKADLNFFGAVSEDGSAILLNEELISFPYLARIILYRQFGKIMGLPDDNKKGHAIMGTHWEINLQHELFAMHLAERPWHKANFFTAMAEKNPIEKRI
jgi:hypothetical protein